MADFEPTVCELVKLGNGDIEVKTLTPGDMGIESDGLIISELEGVADNDIFMLVDIEGEKETLVVGDTQTE